MRRPKPVPTPEEMKSEMELVLTYLQRSTSVGKFLAYICEEYFDGRADRLKEYTIAVEAFGRPESFQPKEDPIVRVHAMRLRQHLAEYYRGEGKDHRVQIRLPKGGYAPEFQLVAAEPETDVAANEATPADADTQVAPELGRQPFWRKPRYIAAGSVLLLCILIALLAWNVYSRQRSKPTVASMAPATTGVSVVPQGSELRITVGNYVPSYIDKLGRLWIGDRYFSGGDGWKPLFEPILRVDDPNLWKYRRMGRSFQYNIPLKPGTYELHLLFFEDQFGINDEYGGGEGSRVFDVKANGQPLLSEFDIVRDAGGARVGDERVFLVSPASDGVLHLDFDARVDRATLSGIEILPAIDKRMRPIRIATRTVPYISEKQVSWRPDQYYSGGRRHEVNNPVTNTEDPELFATERFGNFNYTIPVADGTYTAILYFSETYYGTEKSSEGAGGRVFDVFFNGTTILKNFDIYKEAGGPNRVVRKEFRGLRPDALGKLVFTFHPNRNNPSINAIEIIPED